MDRKKANLNKIKLVIGKKTKYSSLTAENKEIILEELRKTTNNFCPFTGDWHPKCRNWSIEHFYFCQSRFPEKQCEWTNFIHCVGDANVNFAIELDYPNVYSPEEIDYLEVLMCNIFTGKILPKNQDDQKAQNTIKRFSLNSKPKCDSRKNWFKDKNKWQFLFCGVLTFIIYLTNVKAQIKS